MSLSDCSNFCLFFCARAVGPYSLPFDTLGIKSNAQMRLLYRLIDGSIKLEEFYGDRIPPYAILSHTWGDDEFTFKDFEAAASRETQRLEKDQVLLRAGSKG